MPNELKPGHMLKNRYRIEKKIGEGGFSVLYMARDMGKPGNLEERIDKFLVVKESRDEIGSYEQFNEIRFMYEREFRTMQEIDHDSIPKVFDFFDENGKVYFIGEYVSGTLFEDKIKKPLSLTKTVRYSKQILNILKYLHRKGIIHRDLKPGNFILTSSGDLILFDFGTARFYSPDKKGDTIELGTPGYAPPEQYNKSQTDERGDIYALGAMMHQMLTGKNPQDNPFKFDSPDLINKKVPDDLSKIVMKCLQLDPDDRYDNVSAMLGVLKNFESDLIKHMDFSAGKITKFMGYSREVESWKIFYFLLFCIYASYKIPRAYYNSSNFVKIYLIILMPLVLFLFFYLHVISRTEFLYICADRIYIRHFSKEAMRKRHIALFHIAQKLMKTKEIFEMDDDLRVTVEKNIIGHNVKFSSMGKSETIIITSKLKELISELKSLDVRVDVLVNQY
ncbi:MAG: serine/threonine protein kinase [Candidatus Eremiobacteraeota bacterium]|nr:serine/threonine protein kinase [Candidatus Eremiobacteraeota bacterium]